MAFSDIEYGWNDYTLILKDTKIISRVELQDYDEEYKWQTRSAPFMYSNDESAKARIVKYENNDKRRISKTIRVLVAKAKLRGPFGEIYLGVPKDKKSVSSMDKTKVDSIDLSIHELFMKSDDPEGTGEIKHISCGNLSHMDASDDYPSSTYMQLYFAKEGLDLLEGQVQSGCDEITIDVNVKGWYWNGPIGDKQIYVDKENNTKVEIEAIRTVSKFKTNPPEDEESSQRKSDSTESEYLSQILDTLSIFQAPAWIIVILLGWIAFRVTS